jgi:hypothetical protein
LSARWEAEFTDEFDAWREALSESEQGRMDARVRLLMEPGPDLGLPFSSEVKSSRYAEMRELPFREAAAKGTCQDAHEG